MTPSILHVMMLCPVTIAVRPSTKFPDKASLDYSLPFGNKKMLQGTVRLPMESVPEWNDPEDRAYGEFVVEAMAEQVVGFHDQGLAARRSSKPKEAPATDPVPVPPTLQAALDEITRLNKEYAVLQEKYDDLFSGHLGIMGGGK